MNEITRRLFVGTAAAASAASVQAANADVDPALVARHDQAVARSLRDQVTDAQSRGCGSIADGYGLYGAGSAAGALTAFTTSFLQPASKYHSSSLLMERIRLAARFLERAQTPDGNIDLLSTNFNSPPDTAFVVHGVGSAACLAYRAANRELLAVMEPFLKKAGAAMARGGIHTPNHRWVVCSALAQLHEVFPDPAYPRRVSQWLAEGIDIDDDGQYTERSTGGYNAIVDRALIVTAAKLKKPELLGPVRRNLQSMMYLLHPGYEVVTEVSHRQDQYERRDMGIYWFPLRYLAVHDRVGPYAMLADHFAPAHASLTAMMEYPELSEKVEHAAPPENYEKVFPAMRAARIRRGPVSATILLDGDSHFLSFRRGGAVIESVRFASAFFGKGQFVPSSGVHAGGSYELKQSLEAGYYQPLDPPRPVKPSDWAIARRDRKVTELCTLEQTATITETNNGLKLRMRSNATPNVPVAVEIALREGGRLEGCRQTSQGWILESSYATYRVDGDSVRFGPGKAEHRYTQVRGAAPPAPGLRVYLCGYTPFDHEVEIG